MLDLKDVCYYPATSKKPILNQITLKTNPTNRNNKPKFEELSRYPTDDGWLERNVDSYTASFDEEYLEHIPQSEDNYRRNDLDLTPPEGDDNSVVILS